MRNKKVSKTLFFEKKSGPPTAGQKTFAPLRAVVSQPLTQINKVFFASFLFTKKKILLPCLIFSAQLAG
jgi:hypothetical protein